MTKQTITLTIEYDEDFHDAPPAEWDWSEIATMGGNIPVHVTVDQVGEVVEVVD